MAAETVNCEDEAGPKMLDFCLNYVSTHENCVAYLFEHGLLRTQMWALYELSEENSEE